MEAIEEKDNDKLSVVVRDNARVMTLDKISMKLLSEVKKLYCPDPEKVIKD